MKIFGIILAVILILGLLLFGFLRIVMHNADKKATDKSVNPDIKSATDMLPIVDIRDGLSNLGITDLGDGQYRAYLQISSINYRLQSPEDQNVTELQYARLLNTIPFPWVIYLQTHNVDTKLWDRYLEEDVRNTLKDFQQTPAYDKIKEYYAITKLTQEKKNQRNAQNGTFTKEKRKYIILPYNNADYTKGDRFSDAVGHLANMAQNMMELLGAVGLKAKPLTKADIIQLYVSTYNRNVNLFSDNIANNVYSSVYADDYHSYTLSQINDPEKLQVLLEQYRNQLQTNITRLKDIDPQTKDLAQEISDYLDRQIVKTKKI